MIYFDSANLLSPKIKKNEHKCLQDATLPPRVFPGSGFASQGLSSRPIRILMIRRRTFKSEIDFITIRITGVVQFADLS